MSSLWNYNLFRLIYFIYFVWFSFFIFVMLTEKKLKNCNMILCLLFGNTFFYLFDSSWLFIFNSIRKNYVFNSPQQKIRFSMLCSPHSHPSIHIQKYCSLSVLKLRVRPPAATNQTNHMLVNKADVKQASVSVKRCHQKPKQQNITNKNTEKPGCPSTIRSALGNWF